MAIKVGMILKLNSPDCIWTAEFIRIVGNDLYVILRSTTGGSWQETWNLEHTEAGFERDEYIEVLL